MSALQPDIQWREAYVSHALNRKLAGILPVGIYEGFACAIDPSGVVTVGTEGAMGLAVAEYGEYSITVRMMGTDTVTAEPDKPYIVLSAVYIMGEPTTAKVCAVAELQDHHVLLGKAIQEDGQWALKFDGGQRHEAAWGRRCAVTLTRLAQTQIETFDAQLAQHERLMLTELSTRNYLDEEGDAP